ncbi:hypothetical protein Ait01nite_022530 [Actinoplanes italicus]|uniref:hypothetical protein n=1 Tax=Actinoplanes italicus TaxID=113567 RepID=UPI0011B1FD54|nr:hypothetical protein [Actinoplanes italicus]GIE29208.1 hypothetical protein Ait01nite_022530 [Actinoplanes italicus]
MAAEKQLCRPAAADLGAADGSCLHNLGWSRLVSAGLGWSRLVPACVGCSWPVLVLVLERVTVRLGALVWPAAASSLNLAGADV